METASTWRSQPYNLSTENCHFLYLTLWAEAATRGSCESLTPSPRPYWKHCLDLCGCVAVWLCLPVFRDPSCQTWDLLGPLKSSQC